jgi:dTDP-4-amino-4,6-dideoxygalactose transaminase
MHQEIQRLVDTHNLKLIEDNPQALGCCYGWQHTGSISDTAGHSFFSGKNLGTLGEAGVVTTDDEELANVIRSIANYGSTKKYITIIKG